MGKTFKVIERALGDIQAQYPYEPESAAQSLQDYLEDELADGWDLESMSGTRFVFRAVKAKKS